MPTQADYSKQIRDALAVTDPSFSTSLGTPQRKIIEAVASTLSTASTEYTATYYTGFLDSYSGTDLDAYVEQFGFSRHEPGYASGTVVIKRDNAASALDIPYGTTFYKPPDASGAGTYFATTVGAAMAEGVISVEIPVVATVAGSRSNVAAHTVVYTDSFSDYVTVDNPLPMTGGFERETDEALKQRFRNTLFRNMAGTRDQYMGLALANSFVSRARLISETCEYAEVVTVDEDEDGTLFSRCENPDFLHLIDASRLWVKRMSDDVYLDSPVEYEIDTSESADVRETQKVVYSKVPVTSSTGSTVGPFDADGMAWLGNQNVSNLTMYPMYTITDSSGTRVQVTDVELHSLPREFDDGDPDGGVFSIADSATGQVHLNPWVMWQNDGASMVENRTYNLGNFSFSVGFNAALMNSLSMFEDCRIWIHQDEDSGRVGMTMTSADGSVLGEFDDNEGGWKVDAGSGTWIEFSASPYNVEEPDDEDSSEYVPAIELDETASSETVALYISVYEYLPVAVGDFVELSMEYVSDRWRDGGNNVDLYVDGDNLVSVEDIGVMSSANVISKSATPTFFSGAFRRENGTLPEEGNGFIYLTYQPVRSLDDAIAVGAGYTLVENVHYWLVHEDERCDVDADYASEVDYSRLNRGSVRAGDFVELNFLDPTVVIDGEEVENFLYRGSGEPEIKDGTPIHIGYTYNEVPEEVQALVEMQTPVCTDILVHEARRRYVVVCLTVMYTTYTRETVDEGIRQAVIDWANRLPFGSTVQLSDIETVAANLPGVDNVRTTTTGDNEEFYGIIEYDIDGGSVIDVFTNDFKMAADEQLVVNDVRVTAKTQMGW